MQENIPLAASFRDPSGFVYRDSDGTLLRQVNPVYRPHYDQLMASGLYARLVNEGLLIPHAEVSTEATVTLAPEVVPFVSYPYEWCAGQLRDAALLTLRIQTLAMECGMSLKDASAYNVLFRGASPVFIDTLSFEPYAEGRPWIAYGQFCRHFLAPLALMHYVDHGMARLLRGHLDGIPLPLASRALPWRTWLKPGLLLHLHLPARAEHRLPAGNAQSDQRRMARARVSRTGLLGILDSLSGAIEGLGGTVEKSVWGDYYDHTNYSETASEAKAAGVRDYLARIAPRTVWDLGANTGIYSALVAANGVTTVAFDFDHGAVEALYQQEKATPRGLLPLVLDLTNPSPALGWAHRERDSLLDRGPVDCALALALIHHLCIGNNVPLERAAAFFADACRHLVIEFVPKEDSMVQRMLATREDVFPTYTPEHFRADFGHFFHIEAETSLPDSCRTLYWMHNRNAGGAGHAAS